MLMLKKAVQVSEPPFLQAFARRPILCITIIVCKTPPDLSKNKSASVHCIVLRWFKRKESFLGLGLAT